MTFKKVMKIIAANPELDLEQLNLIIKKEYERQKQKQREATRKWRKNVRTKKR